ncbi:2-dehydro-3-deoxygluconokinase [Silvimonas terrae]|uniref:2-dehydro-3-deoxygluconokinase n=1 Tax=Silvimonas terrae TaxID=300266 RepID=A0A840RC24_9NEIS|nr:sugar kinase [Silvimonas terrae]MBB5189910.1 2-dehydro-3-deoxygluconokinase [Silvimonas terrae]
MDAARSEAHKTIAIIGECMVELQRQPGGLAYRFGGDTLNTAVYMARQLKGRPFAVAYLSALGTDSLSDEMVAAWQAEGIHTQLVQRLADKLPGIYLIETDDTGERTFHYWRKDAAARYWLHGPQTPQVLAALQEADVVYLSGISLAILTPADRDTLFDVLSQCKARGGMIVFDNNYRARLWESPAVAAASYRRMLSLSSLALLTLDDEVALYGEADVETTIARTRALGVAEIVIKRGGAASVVATDALRLEVAPVPVTPVVDTTAAGDSFAAGYLAARLQGLAPGPAMQAAHKLAGAVIQHPGAIIPLSAMP